MRYTFANMQNSCSVKYKVKLHYEIKSHKYIKKSHETLNWILSQKWDTVVLQDKKSQLCEKVMRNCTVISTKFCHETLYGTGR